MYLPAHFGETRVDVMHCLMRERPLGALVTLDAEGFNAEHIPFEIDPAPAPYGTLRAHVTRANPVWRNFPTDTDALVIFQGIHGYITPSWYPTKRGTRKVVPTYNYAVVHAYGRVRAIEDREWLRNFVSRLTDRHEAARMERWQVTDAPPDYIDQMLDAIVGIEVTVARLVGKFKMSQSRTPADQAGVVDGLKASGNADDLVMAQLVETCGKPRRGT
ncbi:MAG TPA: FMN-binding negative transcriptional regulator [Burkholderiales bacterium]